MNPTQKVIPALGTLALVPTLLLVEPARRVARDNPSTDWIHAARYWLAVVVAAGSGIVIASHSSRRDSRE